MAGITMMTRMIGITRMTRVTGMTWMSSITMMTRVTRMTTMTRMTKMTRVYTRMSLFCDWGVWQVISLILVIPVNRVILLSCHPCRPSHHMYPSHSNHPMYPSRRDIHLIPPTLVILVTKVTITIS